ncbi:hypothetical protein GCM10023259_051700 [Thermocatellispora tengchongensis]
MVVAGSVRAGFAAWAGAAVRRPSRPAVTAPATPAPRMIVFFMPPMLSAPPRPPLRSNGRTDLRLAMIRVSL